VTKRLRIIFMSTPDFAVPPLKALHTSSHDVVLVVTQPDRPKGRGRIIASPSAKNTAEDLGYNVIQPLDIRSKAFEKQIKEIAPDLIVVVAYGKILPKNILNLPKIGTINIHASLLPKYRGPAPIQWAIINGEKKTGVTTMFMDEGLDTGDILLSSKVEIAKNDTSATLHDRLSSLGGDLLLKTLTALEAGDLNPIPQDHTQATHTTLLKKKDGHVDWEKSAEKLDAFIRGISPWPGAFTFYGTRRLNIFSVWPVFMDADEKPGTVIKSFPDELRVATGKGVLSITEIQGASGKRLQIKEFLRGCKIAPGTVLD